MAHLGTLQCRADPCIDSDFYTAGVIVSTSIGRNDLERRAENFSYVGRSDKMLPRKHSLRRAEIGPC
jgi:hypothetical protein